MKRATSFIAGAIALLSTSAHANLCDSVKDTTTTAETKRDVGFYEELFSPTVDARGNQRWNEIVVQCNRQRDTKGNEIAMATQSSGANADKTLLKSAHLDSKIIRGHYNFFGTIVSQLKYVYVLSKTNGIWTMVIPYKAVFNKLVADRVDFYVGSRKIDPASKGAWRRARRRSRLAALRRFPGHRQSGFQERSRDFLAQAFGAADREDAVLDLDLLSGRQRQVRR